MLYNEFIKNANIELTSTTTTDNQYLDGALVLTEGNIYIATAKVGDTELTIDLIAEDVSSELGAAAGSVVALTPVDPSYKDAFILYSGVKVSNEKTLEFGDFTTYVFHNKGGEITATLKEVATEKDTLAYMAENHIPVSILKKIMGAKKYEYYSKLAESTDVKEVTIGSFVNNLWTENNDLWKEFDEKELYVVNKVDTTNKQFSLGLNSFEGEKEITFKYEGDQPFGEDAIVKVVSKDGKFGLVKATASSLISAPINCAGNKMYKFHFNGVRPTNLRQSYKNEDGTFFMLADNYYGKLQEGSTMRFIDATGEITKINSGNSQMELWVGTRDNTEDKPFRKYTIEVDGTIFCGDNTATIDGTATFYPESFGEAADDTTEFFSGNSFTYPIKMRLSSTKELNETLFIGFHFGNQVAGFLPGTELHIKEV
jgi:hypothetical protein